MIYNLLHFFAIYSPSWRAKRAFFLHSTFGSKFIHFIILKIKLYLRVLFFRNEYCCISISFQKFKDFSKKKNYLSYLFCRWKKSFGKSPMKFVVLVSRDMLCLVRNRLNLSRNDSGKMCPKP